MYRYWLSLKSLCNLCPLNSWTLCYPGGGDPGDPWHCCSPSCAWGWTPWNSKLVFPEPSSCSYVAARRGPRHCEPQTCLSTTSWCRQLSTGFPYRTRRCCASLNSCWTCSCFSGKETSYCWASCSWPDSHFGSFVRCRLSILGSQSCVVNASSSWSLSFGMLPNLLSLSFKAHPLECGTYTSAQDFYFSKSWRSWSY